MLDYEGVEEEAIANWSKRDFPILTHLAAIDDIFIIGDCQ